VEVEVVVDIPSSDERGWICGYPLIVGTILIIPQHFENVTNKWNKAKYVVQKENWFLLCF